MLDDLFSEKLYHVFSYSTTICSCVFNVLLIYVLVVTPVKHVGPYRWLLMFFSIVDKGHLTEFGFICIPMRFLHMPTMFGFFSMLCWNFLVYQTFILLAFHYVYRFVVLCDPSWVSWIQRKPWRNWLSIGITIDLIYAGSTVVISVVWLGPSEQSRRVFAPIIQESYGIDISAEHLSGFLAMTFWIPLENGEKEWQTTSIKAMIVVAFIMLASVTVIIYCVVRIVKAMRATRQAVRDHIESRTRRMQRQLFRALLWQTIIPTITSYTPLALIILMPLISAKPIAGWGTVFLSSMQLFPMIDPFLILFFVPQYRAALPHVIRNNRIVPFKISFSTSTESHPDPRTAPHATIPN